MRKSWIYDLREAAETDEPELFAQRFRVEREAGVGAMGIVYRAIDEETGAAVALKILRGTDQKRFTAEASALARLSHPAIVGYVAHGISREGEPYLVMNWIEGETLGERLARAPLVLEETIGLARRIVQALGAAHAIGLVHRDVKPNNVLLPDRRAAGALLADFGIARFVDAAAPPTTERAVGTPGYMAPEQARASHDIDGRADLFALGCLLFRCLTNREAFEGTDPFTIIAKLVLHEPPRVSELASVPPTLDALIVRLLSKDPDKRPATAALVDAELARAADEVARGRLSRRTRSAPRSWFHAGLGAAALALAATGAFFTLHDRKAPEPEAAPEPPKVLLSDQTASPSCHPEAAAAYREGLQAMRESTWERAHHAFERAVARDPSCPEAALRLLMTSEVYSPIVRQRENLRHMMDLRDALSERNRTVLDSLVHFVVSENPDRPAAQRLLENALRRFPRDAELLVIAADAMSSPSDTRTLEQGLSYARQATDLDPRYADAWQLQGRILAQLGRVEDRLSVLDRCLQVSPGAGDCMRDRILILRQRGECHEAVAEARRWIARDPGTALAYRDLAGALAAEGAPRETLEEALSKRWNRWPTTDAEIIRLHDLVKVAVWTGDFENALALAAQLEKHAAGATNTEPHVRADLMWVETLQEVGRGAEAGRIAERVMRQKDAWTQGGLSFERVESGVYFYEPVMLAAELEQGRITPATWLTSIRAWEAGSRLDATEQWALAWGSAAGKGVDAAEGVKSNPARDGISLEPFGIMAAHVRLLEAYEGHLYLEAGDTARALTSLETAARSCQGLDQPFASVRAHLWLGIAKERTGDTAGACSAYRAVLDRWGAAKPPSVTARDAARRSRALRCP